MRSLVTTYRQQLTPEQIRHLTLNYSMSSQGAKHPNGPVGWIIRDEGQLELYSGNAKSLFCLSGERLDISSLYFNKADHISLIPKGITNFRILGKNFVRSLHDGQKILAIKPNANLNQLYVIGPETRVIVDGRIGEIINPRPILDIFEEKQIFETDESILGVPTPATELFNYMKALIGIVS